MINGINCHGKVMQFYYQISVGTLYLCTCCCLCIVRFVSRLCPRLKSEHDTELQTLRKQLDQSARELESAMSSELSECDALRLQKTEIELRLRLLREEMLLQGEHEKLEVTETWQREKHLLQEKYTAEICNYENMLSLVRFFAK